MTTIDDFLPNNIKIEHGEPSDEFFNEFYPIKNEDKMVQFLSYILQGIIITAPRNNLFHHLNIRIDPDIASEIYYSAEDFQTDYSRKFLQISKVPSVKLMKNEQLTLIIIYTFFENQFFPSIERVVTTKIEELQSNINNIFTEKFNREKINKEKISKEVIISLVNEIAINIFFNTIKFTIPNKIIRCSFNIRTIETHIKSLIYPYISVCKSKYIRMRSDFKDSLYETIILNINNESISNFLTHFHININYENQFSPIVWKYLKEKLLNMFKIERPADSKLYKFWRIYNIHYTNLESAILARSDVINLDDRICISILFMLHKELDIFSILRYILLYKRYCECFNIKEYETDIISFLGELITTYNMTDINAYKSNLDEKDKQFLREQILILNNILSEVVLRELGGNNDR